MLQRPVRLPVSARAQRPVAGPGYRIISNSRREQALQVDLLQALRRVLRGRPSGTGLASGRFSIQCIVIVVPFGCICCMLLRQHYRLPGLARYKTLR